MLAAYVLREFEPMLIEANGKLGGNFLAGGLKYLHDTPTMRNLLDRLGVNFELYQPVGRLNHLGEILPHPEAMRAMTDDERFSVQMAHWAKTRASYQNMSPTCMNDPLGDHGALKCDLDIFMRNLEHELRASHLIDIRTTHPVSTIGGNGAIRFQRSDVPIVVCDLLVPTIPLPFLAKLAPWANLPKAEVTKLFLVKFEVPVGQMPLWDYMYTPHNEFISRLYRADAGHVVAEVPAYILESRCEHTDTPTDQTIANITLQARNLTGIDVIPYSTQVIPGHLQPLHVPLVWPANWAPLGRFAQWDARATADKVLDSAVALKTKLCSDAAVGNLG